VTAAQATRGPAGSTAVLADLLVSAGIGMFITSVRNFEDSLVYDTPFDQNPYLEILDHSHAITFVSEQPEVDGFRIGFIGQSMRGGEAIILAAIDRRVKCVVALVPFLSGKSLIDRWYSPDQVKAKYAAFAADRRATLNGDAPATILLAANVKDDSTTDAYDPCSDHYEFTERNARNGNKAPKWMTLRSQESLFSLEPQGYLHRVSPTPLLMVVAEEDISLGTDVQLRAYTDVACEPKRLVRTKGGHYDIHAGEPLKQMTEASRDWFAQWLG
jgi:fermentation-respiration switch protein FrsA (DUF1100 family)